MGDKDIPNRAAKMEKAEGDRWSSDPSTVERRDGERPESGADADGSPAADTARPSGGKEER